MFFNKIRLTTNSNRSVLLSIIVLNWNTKSITDKCIKRLIKHTDVDYEIIVVDNGSSDGSLEMLKHNPDIRLITLKTNIGYAAGNNHGVKQAQGEYICLVNSDVYVTRRWASKMLSRLKKCSADLVGPCTNNAKGKQKYGVRIKGFVPTPFRKSQDVDYLSFFCVLMKKSFYDEMGGLDTRFGLGMFEDDDFCRRVLSRGGKLVIDGSTWVWHLGNESLKANKVNYSQLFSKNWKIFADKWKLKP